MTKTKELTQSRNHHWLRKWLTGQPHLTLARDGSDEIYMKRWFILPRNDFLNVYLHKFEGSDEERALHDHPYWFVSLILKGMYLEHGKYGYMKLRRAGSLVYRPATWTHRVELLQDYFPSSDPEIPYWTQEKPVWTIFVTGKRCREWGFHCPKGWVHWTDFVTGPEGTKSKGCGEYS